MKGYSVRRAYPNCPVHLQSIEVIGKPVMNCFAIKSTDDKLNILVFADEMETKGRFGRGLFINLH